MEVQNCAKCGRLFYNITEETICPDCRKAVDGKIREVEDFLDKNRTVSLEGAASACHVEESYLTRMIREERIKFPVDSAVKIACEGCGVLIHSGRKCMQCQKKEVDLIHRLSGALHEDGHSTDRF